MNQRGNILAILVVLIMVAGMGVGVYLVTTNKLHIFKSRASADPITPVAGPKISKDSNNNWQTTDPTIEFELKSDLAPAAPH